MLKKSIIMYGSKMLGYAMRLVVPYFLVRQLPVEDFASYRQFFLIEVTIATLFRAGVSHSLYYFIPRDEKNAGAYFLNSAALNMAIYFAVFAGIWAYRAPLADSLNMPLFVEHFPQLLWFTTALMFLSLGDAYLTSRQRIKSAAAFTVGRQLVLSIVTLVVTFQFKSIGAVFTSLTVVSWLTFLILVVYIHRSLDGFKAQRYFFGMGEQIRYGVVLGLGSSMWVMQARIHEFFVSKFYGQEVFAVYSAGCTQIPIVDMYIQSVAVVSLGQFAVLAKQDDWDGILKLWKEVLTSLYGITIPGILFLLAVSGPLIGFMFPPEYGQAVEIFRINTLLKISMLWNAQLVLRGINRNDIVLKVSVAVLLLTLPILYLGMHLGGMLGIIWGQLVLMLLSRFGLQFVNNRVIPVPLPYLVGWGELWAFYRDSWFKLRHRIQSLTAGRSGP